MDTRENHQFQEESFRELEDQYRTYELKGLVDKADEIWKKLKIVSDQMNYQKNRIYINNFQKCS